MANVEFYQKIVDGLIADLQKGEVPWEKPWFVSRAINAVTGHEYRGINQINLALTSMHLGLEANAMQFLTFKQAQAIGLNIRRGEKAVAEVVFFSMQQGKLTKEGGSDTEELILYPLVKFSHVFHVSQVEGNFDFGILEKKCFETEHLAEQIILASNAKIITHQSQAFYSPEQDYIAVPPKEHFKSPSGYYGTIMHELAHWTGHLGRLNRPEVMQYFGSEAYAREELVAELASVFLCSETGIEFQTGNHTAYIQNWLKILQGNPMEILQASKKATLAVEYLLNLAGVKRLA